MQPGGSQAALHVHQNLVLWVLSSQKERTIRTSCHKNILLNKSLHSLHHLSIDFFCCSRISSIWTMYTLSGDESHGPATCLPALCPAAPRWHQWLQAFFLKNLSSFKTLDPLVTTSSMIKQVSPGLTAPSISRLVPGKEKLCWFHF